MADLSSAPVEVVAFLAYPITWSMLYWTFGTSIQNRKMLGDPYGLRRVVVPKGYTYMDIWKAIRAYLTLFRKRLVVRPENNAR